MTATSHAIIGTVIAAKIGDPALAIPIALASHVACDMIPHWDTLTNRENKSRRRLFIDTMVDGLLAVTLSYSVIVFLFPSTNLYYALLIMFFAMLLDLLHGPYTFFKIKGFKWAYDFGKKTNTSLDKPWGVVTQAITILTVILLGKVF